MIRALSFAVILFLTSASDIFAQKRELCSLELKAKLMQMEPTDMLPVYLRGEVEAIIRFIRAEGGDFKGAVGNIVSCSLSAKSFENIGAQSAIQFVEYTTSRPQMLNDVMITNNNIHPVHQGVAPLAEAYFGEDVILGFIDSGIELSHPDFQHLDGTTRVVALWDQTQNETFAFRVPQPFGYGQEWNAEDINAGISNHGDQASFSGHGSNVAGIATGNANATGQFLGVAPKADIIIVSSDFDRPNWKSSIAEAVQYIFERAEAIGKPVVVNASLGDYYGSHDGLDAPALFIDSMLDAAPGRAMVAAAGNSDQFPKYHLSYDIPESDTAFTWFSYNANSGLGYGAVFFEAWADVENFENARFTIGADLNTPAYAFRSYAAWRSASENLEEIERDTIFYNELKLGIVESWCGLRGDQYLIQVVVTQPFSAQYNWRFATTGGGRFDCWSYAGAGSSAILTNDLPTSANYPEMAKYRHPDREKTIVDSWTCSDKVITVGNYVNRDHFINILGETTIYPQPPGVISQNSSRGPTRDNRQKPDIAATGDITIAAGRTATLKALIASNPAKVAQDGMHYVNGGTSMASPVVAGVAALYFSRCPLATYSHFKTSMVDNALADQYTGALPGNQFGHGKLNAYATLAATVSPIAVSSSATSLCEGQEMPLSAASGYVDYQWNNAFSGADLQISTGGVYSVSALDTEGCLQTSFPLNIENLDAPSQPEVILAEAGLEAVGTAFSWQWYLDGLELEGATGYALTPTENGVYTVAAIGANGCSTISEPYYFGVTATQSRERNGGLNLYPNPVRDWFQIDCPEMLPLQLSVFDLSGKMVAAYPLASGQGRTIRGYVGDLADGMYFLHARLAGGTTAILKLVVEK